jgi:hypothetical protein
VWSADWFKDRFGQIVLRLIDEARAVGREADVPYRNAVSYTASPAPAADSDTPRLAIRTDSHGTRGHCRVGDSPETSDRLRRDA